MRYLPAIGLETHIQLLTRSKMFCGCPNSYGLPPNSATCPVCLALPGALPVVNRQAVAMAARLVLAVGGKLNHRSVFARKNYFYPDLPKGYQISQHALPLGLGGSIVIDSEAGRRRIGLTRIHLEEDAGKLLHPQPDRAGGTRVDLNRCGVPLVEVVSQPEIDSPHEAYLYLHRLRLLLLYLGICDGNMEQGSLRCDANVSVRPATEKNLGVRTEVKNLNSITGVEKALSFEIERQVQLLEAGEPVIQQTMLYNDADGRCYPLRSKEESEDYRYFPEPDLPALEITDDWVAALQADLPELPHEKIDRLAQTYGIPRYDATVLASSRELADYYEKTVGISGDPKLSSNWIMTEVIRVLKERDIDISRFTIEPERLGKMIGEIRSGVITGKIGKALFSLMLDDPREVEVLIQEHGLAPVAGTAELEELIEQLIALHPAQARQYRAGRTRLIDFFLGRLMKATGGTAEPQQARKLLREKLDGIDDG
jgi:aspartyl-tRNA(Asn)/glutamyl-tRNA(Gln) amidotransferase subunit B